MRNRTLARLPLTERVTFVYDLQSSLLWGVGSGLALPMAAVIARKAGMGPGMIAFMLVSPYIGMLLSLLWGFLADRRPLMPLFVWPQALGRGSLALMALVREPVGFALVLSFHSMAANLPTPAYAGIMRANYGDADRGRLMGHIRVASTLASAAASWAAGTVLQAHEDAYRLLFVATAVLGVASTAWFGRIKVRRQSPRTPPAVRRGSPLDIRRDGSYLVFLALLFLVAFPGKVFIPLEPVWFVDVLHMDYRGAGTILGTAASLAGILGYLAWGRLSRKREPLKLYVAVLVFTSARVPLVALAGSQYQLIAASAASAIGNAGLDLMGIYVIMKLVDPSRFSLANGVHWALLGARGILGPFLGSFLYERGLATIGQIMWIGTAVSYAALFGMLLFSLRLDRRGPAR